MPSPRIVAISRKHLWAWAARELDGSIFATRFLSRCSTGSRCHRIAASRHGDLIIDISGPYVWPAFIFIVYVFVYLLRIKKCFSSRFSRRFEQCRASWLQWPCDPAGQPGGVAHFQWSSRARRLPPSLSGPPGRFRAFEAPNTGAIRLLFASYEYIYIYGYIYIYMDK